MAFISGFLTRKLIGRRRIFFSVVAIAAAFYLCYQVFSIRRLGEQLSYEAYSKQESQKHERKESVILPEMRLSSSAKPANNHEENGIKIRGVRSKDVELYIPTSKGNFRCIVINEQEIAYNHFNDDYCDCQDGSDEPSTSACPNGRFFCDSTPTSSKQVAISSSKVNDGVCDCCDGSDEWANVMVPPLERIDGSMQRKIGRYQVPCRNVCIGVES
jgi:hypothetical protein